MTSPFALTPKTSLGRLVRVGDQVEVLFPFYGKAVIEVARIARVGGDRMEDCQELDLDAIDEDGWFLMPKIVPVLGCLYHVYLAPRGDTHVWRYDEVVRIL